MPTPILQTKLTLPYAPAFRVPRPRLVAQLDRGVALGHRLLVAHLGRDGLHPAGRADDGRRGPEGERQALTAGHQNDPRGDRGVRSPLVVLKALDSPYAPAVRWVPPRPASSAEWPPVM